MVPFIIGSMTNVECYDPGQQLSRTEEQLSPGTDSPSKGIDGQFQENVLGFRLHDSARVSVALGSC